MIYNGERVFTTKQGEEMLDCSNGIFDVKKRYHKNKVKEGIHYHRLTGEELADFRKQYPDEIKGARQLLWSEEGIIFMAKTIRTDRAYEIFQRGRL